MENEFLQRGLWELWYFFCHFIPFVAGEEKNSQQLSSSAAKNSDCCLNYPPVRSARFFSVRRSSSYLGLEGVDGSPAGFKCYSKVNVCQLWQQVPQSENPGDFQRRDLPQHYWKTNANSAFTNAKIRWRLCISKKRKIREGHASPYHSTAVPLLLTSWSNSRVESSRKPQNGATWKLDKYFYSNSLSQHCTSSPEWQSPFKSTITPGSNNRQFCHSPIYDAFPSLSSSRRYLRETPPPAVSWGQGQTAASKVKTFFQDRECTHKNVLQKSTQGLRGAPLCISHRSNVSLTRFKTVRPQINYFPAINSD